MRLHAILEDTTMSLGDRVMTGHVLHLIYSRSRWSDLCQVTNLFIDSDQRFLELTTRDHKGARSAELKSRLLPLVAPCKGVTSELWAVTYLKVHKLCGLDVPAEEPVPMMRAPLNLAAAQWSDRPLTSEEGAEFIRRILCAPKTAERRLSTHSCKSTLLSWTAKYGLSDNARAVLARHMSCVSATTAVYSRDLLSPILRELENMLQAIRSAMFHPERSRSGMVTPAGITVVPGTPFVVPPAPAPQTPALREPQLPVVSAVPNPAVGVSATLEDSDTERDGFQLMGFESPFAQSQTLEVCEASPDSETTEDNSIQSTSDSEADDVADGRREFLEPSTKFFMNTKSLVIHCERTEGVLKCGRRVSPHFVVQYELHGIRCSRCFDI